MKNINKYSVLFFLIFFSTSSANDTTASAQILIDNINKYIQINYNIQKTINDGNFSKEEAIKIDNELSSLAKEIDPSYNNIIQKNDPIDKSANIKISPNYTEPPIEKDTLNLLLLSQNIEVELNKLLAIKIKCKNYKLLIDDQGHYEYFQEYLEVCIEPQPEYIQRFNYIKKDIQEAKDRIKMIVIIEKSEAILEKLQTKIQKIDSEINLFEKDINNF